MLGSHLVLVTLHRNLQVVLSKTIRTGDIFSVAAVGFPHFIIFMVKVPKFWMQFKAFLSLMGLFIRVDGPIGHLIHASMEIPPQNMP